MKTKLIREPNKIKSNFNNISQNKNSSISNINDQRNGFSLQAKLISDIDNSPAMTLQRKQLSDSMSETIQKMPEEEELLQGKFNSLQRMAPEEEELLQGKFSQPVEREQDNTVTTNLTGMPDQLKTGLESLSGMDMSDVRVHNNSSKPAQLNALAYAQGNDIHLGAGQEQHLPHEAWHVVQQRQGRVQPTMQMEGQQINDDAGLEREADVMGAKAVQYKK